MTLHADGTRRSSTSAPPSSATAPRRCTCSSSPTSWASTPSRVRLRAARHRRRRLRHRRLRLDRARWSPGPRWPTRRAALRERSTAIDGPAARTGAPATGEHHGTPRSVAFNVHGFRVAVDPRDRRGADPALGAGRRRRRGDQPRAAARPGRGRGGAGDRQRRCYEELVDGSSTGRGAVTRDLPRLPGAADGRRPATEVLFADTVDELGPRGAKSMSEAPYNPVAPALANADPRRHRRTAPRAADEPGPDLAAARETAAPTAGAAMSRHRGDQYWLARAVELAVANVAAGGGPFGAVVVRGDRGAVATGQNRVTRDNDPTAHAEVLAIRAGLRRPSATSRSAGCVLYTSCEPCPLCVSARCGRASTGWSTPPTATTPPAAVSTTGSSTSCSPSERDDLADPDRGAAPARPRSHPSRRGSQHRRAPHY